MFLFLTFKNTCKEIAETYDVTLANRHIAWHSLRKPCSSSSAMHW